ncbi:MAG: FHA domain-containing protein [Acidobacteria bacterium]|nr:FHA domain-containing protein [Acidobacteriota bacterium]MBU4493914.1 FHA domain-containing protein [Acidobacteriota bacterium]
MRCPFRPARERHRRRKDQACPPSLRRLTRTIFFPPREVYPEPGTGLSWPVVVLAALLLLRRRKESPGIFARLDIVGHDGIRRSLEIRRSRTRIGRSTDNDLVIDDPEISSHHLEIVAAGGAFLVRDLGSSNGTFVNGRPVGEQALQSGDEIVLGKTSLRLVI